jgi:hypothetical protein
VACIAVIAGAGTAPAAHGAERLRVITSGAGKVTSADGRIDCGDDCSANYREGRTIRLKAVPGPGYEFAHWKGACFGKSPRCVVALTRRSTVRAKFVGIRRFVSLVVSGPGAVVSEPRGLYCSGAGSCQASFRGGTTVRLNAVPDANGVFHAWGGTACQGQASTTCEFVVPGDVDVTTAFRDLQLREVTPTLTLTLSGGHVTSSPPGIDCPPTCSAAFPGGTPVTLTAATHDTAWIKGCEGFGPTCALVLDRSTEVQPVAPSPPPPPLENFGLSVTVSGPGTVSGGPTYASDAIFCGATGTLLDCQQLFPKGTAVTLKAVRRKGGRFVRWTSFCSGRKPQCTLRMTAPKTVGAVFRRG